MSKQIIELQQKVKTLIDTGSNEIIKKNEVQLDAAMKKIYKDISEISKDMNENKVELTDGMMKMEKAMSENKLAMLKIDKDMSEIKVEVNNKIESLLFRMNLDKLESN